MLCVSVSGLARDKIGSWREHYAYLAATKLCEWNDELVVVTPEGLMVYTFDSGEIRLLSSLTGLTEKSVVDVGFDAQTQSLLVAYTNGIVDVLWNDQVFSVKDIRSFGSGNNRCKGLLVGSEVYAYGSFGIAVLDVIRREVKDNFWPMLPTDPEGIQSLVEQQGRLYAATKTAVYSIATESALKTDPTAWRTELSGVTVHCMLGTREELFVAIENGDGKSSIRKRQNNEWTDYYDADCRYTRLSETPDQIWGMGEGKMQQIHKRLAYKMNEWSSYGKPWPGFDPRWMLQKNGKRWIADATLGLIVWDTDMERIRPIRPDVLSPLGVDAGSSGVWVLAEGLYAKYFGHLWANVYDTPLKGATCVEKTPNQDDGFVIGSQSGKVFKRIAQTWDSVRIGSGAIGVLQYDRFGNLWGIRSASDGPVFVERNGQTQRLDIAALATATATQMLYDTYGIVWVLFPNKGLLAVQATGSGIGNVLPALEQLRYRLVSPQEMGISGFRISSMASDKDGVLWLGTTGGVFAVYNAAAVFGGTLTASRVLVKTSVEGQGAYLLETETVSAVAVDGANRKWFGTEASGLYLQSANGAVSIRHFTPENSPLPSQQIQRLNIEPQSGEVFVYTDAGLISYMPDASEASSGFSTAKIFPNPVRPEYSGDITLTGLKENTRIRVTDIAGDLCAEGISNGGVWVWNGKTLRGKRPATGVYLFFLSDEAGQETKILKLLFVH